MENVDLPSAIRKVPFFAPLAESPNLYILPNDFSFNGLIDVYARDYTTNRLPRIRTGVGGTEFMRKLQNSNIVEIENIDGVQFLNIRDQEYKRMYPIDPCDIQTASTFTALGTATNIRFDSTSKISGTGSIAFESVASTDFWVSQTTFFAPASLTDMEYITMYVYFPDYTDSVTVKYGTDVSNYKTNTITTDWQGNRMKKGWNTLLITIDDATEVGTTGDTVEYFTYTIGSSTALQTDYRINGIYLTADYPYDIRYYSNSIITNQYGERKDNCLPTSDTDVIILNNREHSLFLKQFSVLSSIDTMTEWGARQFNAYNQPLQKAYESFMSEFPSERVLITTPY